jgi:hypothetical protein
VKRRSLAAAVVIAIGMVIAIIVALVPPTRLANYSGAPTLLPLFVSNNEIADRFGNAVILIGAN